MESRGGREGRTETKSQSSIEYLIGYGLVILVIAITVGLLYTVLSGNQRITTQNCQFSSGISCADMVIGSNTVLSNTVITLFLINAQTSPITNPTISINISGTESRAYACTPNYVNPGGEIFCNVNVPKMSTINQFVSGTMYLSANDCQLAKGSCTSAPLETYEGQFSGYAQQPTQVGFTVWLTAQSSMVPRKGEDLLTAQVMYLGTPVAGATVNFSISAQNSADPQYSTTNSSGMATSYISLQNVAKLPYSVKVYANFSSAYSCNVIITFVNQQTPNNIPVTCT